jgi:hypothetical protein
MHTMPPFLPTQVRKALSRARRYCRSLIWDALEAVSYGTCRVMGWGHTTLCARSYDLQGEYSLWGIIRVYNLWAIFRRVADWCHPEADHCRKSWERHL